MNETKEKITTESSKKSSYIDTELIDQEEIKSIYSDIMSVVKSKNPLDFYFKIKTIKDEIAKIIKSIIDEILEFFDINNKSKIYELYYQVWYGENIKNHLRYYIEQSKYFDVRFYFTTVILFDKEKQYIIKCLIKLYKWESDENINKFLKKFLNKKSQKVSLKKIKSIFEEFHIDKLKIAKKYLNENKANLFMEQIYLKIKNTETRNNFLNVFKIYINNYSFSKEEKRRQILFQELIRIFGYITQNYIRLDRPDGQKDMEYIDNNIDIKTSLDKEIELYFQNKNIFYNKIITILNKKDIDKYVFWRYVRTQMINKYFPEAKMLFYWNCVNEFQNSRWTWNSLAVDTEDNNDPYIRKLCDFKNMIISIQSNTFWTFWKPIIYSLILDTLKIDKKGFDKMFFIMSFIIANNYGEYKQLYKFFNEIKSIYWFEERNKFYTIIWKINLSLSIIIWLIIIFWWLYAVAPFGLFVSLVGLAIIYYTEYLFNNTISSKLKINLWLKAYFTIASILFGFTFVINLWKQIDEWWSYTQKLNNLSQITTEEAFSHIKKWDFWEYSADILNNGKKKENKESLEK